VKPARRATYKAGIETGLNERPTSRYADVSRQSEHIIVGVRVAEGLAGGMEQVLAVDEHDGALVLGLRGTHRGRGKK